jgi:hypothetical protein
VLCQLRQFVWYCSFPCRTRLVKLTPGILTRFQGWKGVNRRLQYVKNRGDGFAKWRGVKGGVEPRIGGASSVKIRLQRKPELPPRRTFDPLPHLGWVSSDSLQHHISRSPMRRMILITEYLEKSSGSAASLPTDMCPLLLSCKAKVLRLRQPAETATVGRDGRWGMLGLRGKDLLRWPRWLRRTAITICL